MKEPPQPLVTRRVVRGIDRLVVLPEELLSEEFGLHPLAVKAALRPSQRPKLDRYRSHLLHERCHRFFRHRHMGWS